MELVEGRGRKRGSECFSLKEEEKKDQMQGLLGTSRCHRDREK